MLIPNPIVKYGAIVLVTLLVFGGVWYHGYDSGIEKEKRKLERAKAESQETINALSSEAEQLRQENQRLQMEAPNVITQYIERRGSDPVCFDADGLQLLSRYRSYPAKPNE